MLEDVWAVSLESETLEWRCLYDGSQDNDETFEVEEAVLRGKDGVDKEVEGDEREEVEKRRKKKKRKKKRHAPLPRKGHVAVAIEDEERPLLVSFSALFRLTWLSSHVDRHGGIHKQLQSYWSATGLYPASQG